MGEIKKQSLSNVLISYAGLLIGFINVMVLQPWMLSAEEIGLTRVLYAIAVLGGTIFPLGMGGSVIKFLPSFRNREKGHHGFLGTIILITLPLFVLLVLIMFFTGQLWMPAYAARAPLLQTYSHWLFPMIFVVGYSNLISIYLFADFQSVNVSWINDFFIRIYTTIITSVYFLKVIDQKGFFLLFAAGYFLQLILLFYFATKASPLAALRIQPKAWSAEKRKQFLSYTLAMTLISISGMALKNLDVILLGGLLNLDSVAIYSIALLVAGFIELPATSIGRIADSRISDAHQNNNHEEIKNIYFSSVRILTITGLFLFTCICTCISDVLHFLPARFAHAALPTMIIGIGALSNMSTGINSSILFYTSQVRTGTWLSIGLVMIMILLNIRLIPIMGVEGAAVANALSFFLFNFSKWLIIRSKFGWNPFGGWFFNTIVFTSCLNLILLSIPASLMPPAASLPIKGIIIAFLFFIYIDKSKHFGEVKSMKDQWVNKIYGFLKR